METLANHPLVTVVMPAYNRADLIADSIQSVLDQTYQNWELVIADDGSTDDTRKVVSNFTDPRIHYHRFEHNGGFGTARNRGIKLAKGSLIAFLDSDDLWRPDKLMLQVLLLSQHPESAFVFNNIELFGDTTIQAPEYSNIFDAKFFPILLEEKEVVFYPSTLIFKKSVVEKIGLLSEQSPTGADHDFLLTMSLAFKGSFSNERLVRIRKHAANTSSTNKIFGYPDSIAHATKFFNLGVITKSQFKTLVARYYYKMGLVLLNNSEPGKALDSFVQHCRNTPWNGKGWMRLMQSILRILRKPFT
jgi:glycosyltransferase involved in cell wall biosynthesis